MAALGVAVAAVSTAAILVRWSRAPSSVAAFYRVLFTLALIAPFALGDHSGEFRQLSRRDAGAAVVAGVALALHFASWFESLSWTSVAASTTLVQTQPVFVAVGAALVLGEYVDRRVVLGIGVALCGAVVMSLADPEASVAVAGEARIGNALAVVGAAAGAAYFLAGRSIRQRVTVFPYVTVVYAACAATLLVVVLARGQPLFAYPPREWLLFLGLAVGPGLFGHTVVNWALEHVRSTVASVALLGEPVGATLLALLLLSEVPTTVTLAGGGVVIAGIYLTSTARRRPDAGGAAASSDGESGARPDDRSS
ncbi:DMT family transporter [Natronoarchaeum philippinense]|nr:DMT family transporter [Natronoarchaeum philippinense]